MSFSQPRVSNTNPANGFVQWKGSGAFAYDPVEKKHTDERLGGWYETYNRATRENDKFDLSEGFIILDADLFSITGYRDRDKMQVQSNAVRGIDDVLIVKGYKDKNPTELEKGTYRNLKEKFKDIQHYRYTREVYFLNIADMKLYHLKLTGKSIVEFGNTTKGCEQTHVILPNGFGEDMAGTNPYVYPLYKLGPKITPEQADKAMEIDSEILQPYLKKYLSGSISQAPVGHQGEANDHMDFDPKKWRELKLHNGKFMSDLKFDQISQMEQDAIDAGEIDGILWDALQAAKQDYSNLDKKLESMKDRDGRAILDYSIDELREAKTKLKNPFNELHQLIEIAERKVIKAQERPSEDPPFSDDIDEDDIPF